MYQTLFLYILLFNMYSLLFTHRIFVTCERHNLLSGNYSTYDNNLLIHPGAYDPPSAYMHIGSCNQVWQHCGAHFWYEECLKTTLRNVRPNPKKRTMYTGFGSDQNVTLKTQCVRPLDSTLVCHTDLHRPQSIVGYPERETASTRSTGENQCTLCATILPQRTLSCIM